MSKRIFSFLLVLVIILGIFPAVTTTADAAAPEVARVKAVGTLKITTQPTDKNLPAGKTAKFTVKAAGEGLKYQWQYRTSAKGSWKAASATGNKTATVSVPATASRNGWQYRCKITDKNGKTVYSNAATLKIVPLKITTQPSSVTLAKGKTATFKVVVKGTGLKYQWQYRTSAKGAWKKASATGNKTATLKVPVTAAKNGYQYRCKITDKYGNVINSNAAKLTVSGKTASDNNHGTMVWIPTNGGTKYHAHAGCSNMVNPDQVTQSEAEELGFTPCKRCY